jgi:hypothetical protein
VPHDAADLPISYSDSPVKGAFVYSPEAEWEVDGKMVPTFEIRTPSANYWLVASIGTIVSVSDPDTASDPRQWVAYSTGFRPKRSFPSFGSFLEDPVALEQMTTEVDESTKTASHLRYNTSNVSGSWRLVYDFYPTHVTLTVNAAPAPYGIAYAGVIGSEVDSTDTFTLSDGSSDSAQFGASLDAWAGTSQWAVLTDPQIGRSLFVIQHASDSLSDRFLATDGDTAVVSFGDGALTALPMRFSLGLSMSDDIDVVEQRLQWVIDKVGTDY